jgi:type IV secretory pathway VirB3-like protein
MDVIMAVLARLTIERWVVEVVCMFVLLCGYASSNDDQRKVSIVVEGLPSVFSFGVAMH